MQEGGDFADDSLIDALLAEALIDPRSVFLQALTPNTGTQGKAGSQAWPNWMGIESCSCNIRPSMVSPVNIFFLLYHNPCSSATLNISTRAAVSTRFRGNAVLIVKCTALS